MIDVILIKYCLTKEDETEWDKTYSYLSKQEGVNVLTRDNTNDNIGLIQARVELVEQSEAEYVCFMDFDFSNIDIDLMAMSKKLKGDVAMVIPESGSSWGLKEGIPCNCILMKRKIYESLGGYDDRYFIAYGDWDLVTKAWNAGLVVARHQGSKLSHNGSSNKNPHKRQLWEKDRIAYVDKWSTVYQGMKNDKILLSNPDDVDCQSIVLGFQENVGEIHMFTGVHDLNFWHSEFFRYDKVYHIPSIYRDNYNIVNACQENGININLMLSNSAIIVIPYRNCEKFIGECIDSITSQTWKDLGVILIDDDSDDNTMQEAMSKLNGKVANIYVKNKERQWALKNIDYAISNFCADYNSVIFLVDGDDKLNSPTAIEEMMTQHLDNDLVWSSYVTSQAGVPSCCGSVDDNRPIRKQPWHMSHLRSFKKFLFDAIDRDEFKENGDYLKTSWDRAIMCPIAEMTPPNKRKHYPKYLYWYRFHAENDHVVDRAEQVRVEKLIHSRPPAQILERYNSKKKVLDITVVVSCFNQLYVLPKFLESMFFQTQLPTKVIVADDGSSDGVCEWVDENAHRYPFKLSYVTREHEGYRLASLNNFATSEIKDGRVLFTNADVLHSPNSIKAHAEVKGVAGGVVIGIATNRAESVTIDDVRDYNRLSEIQKKSPSGRHNLGYIKSTNPQWNPIGVWGGNFSVPADKFHETNGFDEGFKGWGGEDNELVKRLIKAGCKVEWVMDSKACHLDHENKKYAYDQSGSNYYFRKMNG